MALNSNTLKTAILNKLNEGAEALNPLSVTALADYHEMIASSVATAVVDHIKASGAVTTVTACPAGAGSGTGTIA